jgi:hypothetical protein
MILGSVVGPQLVGLLCKAFEVGEISSEQQHAQLLWDAAQKLSGEHNTFFRPHLRRELSAAKSQQIHVEEGLGSLKASQLISQQKPLFEGRR